MDIQYIFTVHGKGIDMAEKKQLFQQALELIIDGVALNTTGGNRAQVGAYLMGLVVADNQGQLDAEKVEAIQLIIEMAAETESPMFKMS
ncbi:hypothetical protein [Vibrio scophthalmi]|uniref:Uncharacterized protein n=1 Tax=Vibrio scophthalmi LMG 19158 TaxID=870967 RepID=F9RLT5_9VIBR|nr:hypothetical protein [Vibrio scophthalmi]EGU38635.1 hypothetical protein VIS19158_02460 [Vibrio scophthalmi LMG 19158]